MLTDMYQEMMKPDPTPIGASGRPVITVQRIDNDTVVAGSSNYGSSDSPSAMIISKDKGKTWVRPIISPRATGINAFLKHKDGSLSVASRGNTGVIKMADIQGSTSHCSSASGGKGASFLSIVQLKSGTVLAGNGSDFNSIIRYQPSKDPSKPSLPVTVLSGIWRSENGGACGSYTKSNMQQYPWGGLEAFDDGSALAGCGYNDSTEKQYCTGIHKSIDDGVTWDKIPDPLMGNKNIHVIKAIRGK